MVKKTVWIWLAGLVLTGSGAAHAQLDARGLIIRVVDQLVYIDLGSRDGVQPGDLYDIVAADVLADPLSGDTLAVSPTRVGAIRVLQVFDKMSVAELLHVQKGEDPVLMKIAPIEDPDRLVEIEQFLHSSPFSSAGPSRMWALVPGIYQFRSGNRGKGGALLLAEAASLAAGLAYRINSNDWKEQYDKLPAGLPQSEYDYYFGEANDRRTWSNRFFWLAGALYAYNWIDVLWRSGGPDLEGQAQTQGWPAGLALGVQVVPRGGAVLQLVHRF
jgi:hypothetical protein